MPTENTQTNPGQVSNNNSADSTTNGNKYLVPILITIIVILLFALCMISLKNKSNQNSNQPLFTPTAIETEQPSPSVNENIEDGWKNEIIEIDNKAASASSIDMILNVNIPSDTKISIEEEEIIGQARISNKDFEMLVFWSYEVEGSTFKSVEKIGNHIQSGLDIYRVSTDSDNLYATEVKIDENCEVYELIIKPPCGMAVVETNIDEKGNWFQAQCISGDTAICDRIVKTIELSSRPNTDFPN